MTRWPGDVSSTILANDDTDVALELGSVELVLGRSRRLYVRLTKDWGGSGSVWRAAEPTYSSSRERE